MDQELSNDLVVYLGLQGFAVEPVELVRAPRPDAPDRRIKVVHVSNRGGRHQCPDCGRHIRPGLFEEFEPVSFRDASIGDFETHLRIHAMRVACCGGTRVEQLPFAMPGFRMTRRFFERIAALCTKLPVWCVAKMAGLSWDTVARVDKRAIEVVLGNRKDALKGLRWIGVDEVSRTGGHVYFTVVTNLLSGRVVWIGDGKGEKGFLPFLEALGQRGRRRIRGAVSDLGYQAVLAAQLPHAVHVLDRFHIVQWVNEALNQLRRRLFSGAPKDEVGRTFKIKKWLVPCATAFASGSTPCAQPTWPNSRVSRADSNRTWKPWSPVTSTTSSSVSSSRSMARSPLCASKLVATETPSTSSSRSSSAAPSQTTLGPRLSYDRHLTDFREEPH